MSHAFADIAFTPAVKAAQARDGSRANYARNFDSDAEVFNQSLGEAEADFIGAQRSLYMATVSETGWPYLQHRGGPPGFVKVLDARTLAFADFAGNRQLISVGNAAGNDRVALMLMDYTQRRRLKLLGRLVVSALAPGDALFDRLVMPGYKARPQRALTITVDGFDWNCPQHIPLRLEALDVQRALDERDARIAALEAALKAELKGTPSSVGPG
jgi:uncharacterized protein